jgi:hypothetical protein
MIDVTGELIETGISDAFPTCTRMVELFELPMPNCAGPPESPTRSSMGSGRLLAGVAVSRVTSVSVAFLVY